MTTCTCTCSHNYLHNNYNTLYSVHVSVGLISASLVLLFCNSNNSL